MSCKRSCYRNNVALLSRKCRSRSDAAWCGVRSDLHCLLTWFRILFLSIIKLHHIAKLQKYNKDNNSEKCEPRHEKTCFLHMRKQRRRSAAQLLRSGSTPMLRYRDSTIPLLLCTARFVLDLVGNPEDRFSHDDATMHKNVSRLMIKPASIKKIRSKMKALEWTQHYTAIFQTRKGR